MDKGKLLRTTYLRASKDILPVPYEGCSFSSNVLLVKDFLMLLLEVLLLDEDLAKEVKAENIFCHLCEDCKLAAVDVLDPLLRKDE